VLPLKLNQKNIANNSQQFYQTILLHPQGGFIEPREEA